jgi:hypothetical protein
MGRQKEHHDTKAWWKQVVRTEWLHFQHKERALAMEEWLIRMFRPKHNIQHNNAPPMSEEKMEYAELIRRKRDIGLPLLAHEQRLINSADKRSPIRQKCDALLEQLEAHDTTTPGAGTGSPTGNPTHTHKEQ